MKTPSTYKVLVQNCVLTINGYIKWIGKRLPDESAVIVAHIPGKENISDILTKAHPTILQLDSHSTWQHGPDWMAYDQDAMPLTYFTELSLQGDEVSKFQEEQNFALLPSLNNSTADVLIHVYPNIGEFGETTSFVLPFANFHESQPPS